MVRTISAITIALLAITAQAECVLRSTSVAKVAGQIDDIADIVPMLGPVVNKAQLCSVKARVFYKNSWYTTFGEYTGPADIGAEELCINAVEVAVRQFLATKEAKLINNSQQLTCSDEEPIKIRSVQKGEMIKLSEVRLDKTKADFTYKGALCKWFSETTTKNNDLYQWSGIVCNLDNRTDQWAVVDKF